MRSKKPYVESEVLALLATGSEVAFEQVFEHHRSRIFFIAKNILRSETTAEEVVHDVFMKVWTKREELHTIRNFKAWLFAVTRNHIYDTLEIAARQKTESLETLSFLKEEPSENSTNSFMLEQQYEKVLEDAVSELSPRQQEVFRLAKIEGLSHKAIASRLNISSHTVHALLKKALATVRLRLQNHITAVGVTAVFIRIFNL